MNIFLKKFTKIYLLFLVLIVLVKVIFGEYLIGLIGYKLFNNIFSFCLAPVAFLVWGFIVGFFKSEKFENNKGVMKSIFVFLFFIALICINSLVFKLMNLDGIMFFYPILAAGLAIIAIVSLIVSIFQFYKRRESGKHKANALIFLVSTISVFLSFSFKEIGEILVMLFFWPMLFLAPLLFICSIFGIPGYLYKKTYEKEYFGSYFFQSLLIFFIASLELFSVFSLIAKNSNGGGDRSDFLVLIVPALCFFAVDWIVRSVFRKNVIIFSIINSSVFFAGLVFAWLSIGALEWH